VLFHLLVSVLFYWNQLTALSEGCLYSNISKCMHVCLSLQSSLRYFICDLRNGTVSSSDYMMFDDRMINELERMWKEVVTACFNVLS
jgi:hypothetical protein